MTSFRPAYDERIVQSWSRRHVDPVAGDTGNLWLAANTADPGTDGSNEATGIPRTPLMLNHIQQLEMTGSPTGGTFTLTTDEVDFTVAIAFDATADDIQEALMALAAIINPNGDWSQIGAVACSGGPINTTPVLVEFYRAFSHTGQSVLIADATNLTGGTTPDVAISTETSAVNVFGAFTDHGDSGGRQLRTTDQIEVGNATVAETCHYLTLWSAESGGEFIGTQPLANPLQYQVGTPVVINADALGFIGTGYSS